LPRCRACTQAALRCFAFFDFYNFAFGEYMKLINNKKTPSSLAVTTAPAPAQPTLDDLTALAGLVQPIRNRQRDLDAALVALGQMRRQLRETEPAPSMMLTVQRELVAQQGDAQMLALFDQEHGTALAAEQTARENALRNKTEVPARIAALETLIGQLAQQMIEQTPLSAIQGEAERLFAPFCDALAAAASTYVDTLSQAYTAASVLENALAVREMDLFGESRNLHRVELMGKIEPDNVVPDPLGPLPIETLRALNHRNKRLNLELVQRMEHQLDAAGIRGPALKMVRPMGPYEDRKIATPA
jgi:hypothetical protein